MIRGVLGWCKEHIWWVTTIATLFPSSYLLGKEKILDIAKLLAAEWKLLLIPVTVYITFNGLPGFLDFLDRRNQNKLKREREEAEREERKKKDKWENLVAEIGRHKALAKNVSEGNPLRFPEDFEKQRSRIICALEEYGFSAPSKEDLFAEDFDKCWFKFLEEGFREIAGLYLDKAPKEEGFLKLWEEYKPK